MINIIQTFLAGNEIVVLAISKAVPVQWANLYFKLVLFLNKTIKVRLSGCTTYVIAAIIASFS